MASTLAGRASLRANKPAHSAAAPQPTHSPPALASPAPRRIALPLHPAAIPGQSEQERDSSRDWDEPGISLPIQRKLAVGTSADPLEDEADRFADQVTHATAPSRPRRCACGGKPGPDGECAACKAKRLARMAISCTAPALQSAPPRACDLIPLSFKAKRIEHVFYGRTAKRRSGQGAVSTRFCLPYCARSFLFCCCSAVLAQKRFAEVHHVVSQGAPQGHAFDFAEAAHGQRRQPAISS